MEHPTFEHGSDRAARGRASRIGLDARRKPSLGLLCSGSVGAIVASFATGALAQSVAPVAPSAKVTAASLEEVVVTARRREEKLQDVPAAITAITAADLAAKQVTTQNDLKFVAPSLSIQGRYGHQGGTYAIRGLSGSTTGSATVGTYFAEVPSAQGSAGYDVSGGTSLYDIESVQVLKGPQGTLFGRTTTAGAVLVTPRRPGMQDFSGDAEVTVGSLGRHELNLALGGPLVAGKLGFRLALNQNHLDGYTTIIGTNERLDETNTRSYRASLEFDPVDWLHNTTIYDNYHSDAAPGSFITVGYNAALPSFNLPANTTAFNSVCATAVAAGLAPSVAACVSQRLAILATIKSDLAAEVARTSAGGKALRAVNTGLYAPYHEVSNREVAVNTTILTLPSVDGLEWQFKNIFGYQRISGCTVFPSSSIPIPNIIASGSPGGCVLNQSGNQIVNTTGSGYKFYTDEPQLSGSFGKGRLVWVAGYYYQNAPLPRETAGMPGLGESLGGVTTYNLGYAASATFPLSGRSTEKAYYAQATLGLDGLIDGVHLTAGFRHSQDYTTSTVASAVVNTATGVFSPSATTTTAALTTSGTGYNFSIDYKPTPSILLYVTARRGYVPGNLNTLVAGATAIPNYAPAYGPEIIKDYELGAKTDFQFANVRGRFNLDYYHDDYTNIQRTQQGQLPTGAFIIFTANVAAAKLSGFEGALQLLIGERTNLGIDYSYNQTGYTKWMGNDALNLLPAGTVLDLSHNPFPNAPKQKLSVNASYDLLESDTHGAVTLTGQAYVQSREWWTAYSQRFLDAYGESHRDEISQPAYAVFNAKIDWTDVMGHKGLDAGLFIRNLANKTYTTSGLVNLNSNGWAAKTFAEPRTWGLNLAYHY